MNKQKSNFKRLVTVLIATSMFLLVLPQVSADSVGMVSYWDFDQGSGSIAYDATTNGNDGIFTGGVFGNALEFDGIDDYVNIPDDPSLDITSDITLEAWININDFTTSAGYHMYIIGKDSGQRSYGIGVDLTWQQSKHPFVIMFHSNSVYSVAWGLNQLAPNQWYHIAGVFDETNDILTLYIDGVPQQTQTSTSTINIGTADVRIGGRQYPGHECYFNGRIDEVRISNNVRYSTSFTPSTNPFTTDGNTVGLWHFDESTGSTANDESANENDGTINGAAWAGPTWTTGYLGGYALHLDGVDDYVRISDDITLEPETITIDCYVKSDVLEYYAHIISKDYSTAFGASSYALYTGSTRGLYFYVKTSSGYALSPNAGTWVWDGQWHHVVGTYDGINPRLFVDGTEISGTPGTGDDILYSATGNLLIGKYSEFQTHPTYDFCFYGDIDEVKIYNYAMYTLSIAFDPTSDAVIPVDSDANIRTIVTDGLGNTVEGVTITLSSPDLTLSIPSGVSDANGILAFTASSTTTGIYTITATISTLQGDQEDTWTLVIYDPTSGFVTGGGWIMSPAGAYVPDQSLSGKANFGFVSKYKKGQSTPTGNTEFQFQVANLNFHSSDYDWLVIAGNKAVYKGSGTINDQGDYKFMITAWDENPTFGDTFRIKIWEEDEYGTETIIYDNGVDTPLGGGQIKIHNG